MQDGLLLGVTPEKFSEKYLPGYDHVGWTTRFHVSSTKVSIAVHRTFNTTTTTTSYTHLLTIAMRGVWLLSILLPLVPGIKADGSLYPPGLMPLITHANSLLSAGKFGAAATAYSQAIGKARILSGTFGNSSLA